MAKTTNKSKNKTTAKSVNKATTKVLRKPITKVEDSKVTKPEVKVEQHKSVVQKKESLGKRILKHRDLFFTTIWWIALDFVLTIILITVNSGTTDNSAIVGKWVGLGTAYAITFVFLAIFWIFAFKKPKKQLDQETSNLE